jgi:uncharacterized protein (DUF1800 family)
LGVTLTTKNVVIAAKRFGLGARPGDLSRLGGDAEFLLIDQLQDLSRPRADIRALPGLASAFVEVQDVRRERREMRSTSDIRCET